jgi:hypothetical protein
MVVMRVVSVSAVLIPAPIATLIIAPWWAVVLADDGRGCVPHLIPEDQ